MRDFTPFELYPKPNLLAFRDPTSRITYLKPQMVIVRLRPELNFLNFNILLLFPSLALAPLFLVLKLAKIHDPANGGISIWRDLDQVKIAGLSHFQRAAEGYNSDIPVILRNQTNFSCAYLPIHA